jgi:hypothetical protein
LFAVPIYLVAVGAGHVWLAMQFYERTTGLARDGQAFSLTAVIGLGFIVLGIVATPVALLLERSRSALALGALVGLAMAAAVIAYTAVGTAIQGYVTGGVPGELHCIVEGGREICPPGDGTWIAEARTDPLIMLVGGAIAYVLANGAARYRQHVLSTSPVTR